MRISHDWAAVYIAIIDHLIYDNFSRLRRRLIKEIILMVNAANQSFHIYAVYFPDCFPAAASPEHQAAHSIIYWNVDIIHVRIIPAE